MYESGIIKKCNQMTEREMVIKRYINKINHLEQGSRNNETIIKPGLSHMCDTSSLMIIEETILQSSIL